MAKAKSFRIAAAVAATVLTALTGTAPAAAGQRFVPPTIEKPSFKGETFDVRSFGAKGDGTANDTDAVSKAIDAASRSPGGGTVHFPAGTYASFSVRLKSHVILSLGAGATLLAADPASGQGRYDAPEPNEHDLYQDFGHSHWQNSLIWGIGVEDVGIVGPGRIDGKGLTRRGPGARWKQKTGDRPLSMAAAPAANVADDPEAAARSQMEGLGNKAIALKLSRHVVLRDFSILQGGHFAVLATGVDDLTIDNVKIDTNRDGLDIDACRDVRISNTSVNAPNDDAIVLKSTYALGYRRATENVTITNCQVTGYDLGTFFGGAYGRTQEQAPDRDGVTGRIKLGTESNGGFRNITISNCVFDRSRGLALETVDGGDIEDVAISNITMRDITTAPLFFRIGNRGRGPGGPAPGALRRVAISNLVAYDVEPRFASIIAGLPGHPVEDVQISNVRIVYKGGGTAEDAARVPPENETAYPEPSMFGTLPAYGLFVRHAKNVALRDVEVSFLGREQRPAVALHDVDGIRFDGLRAARTAGVPLFTLRDVRGFAVLGSPGLPDTRRETVKVESLP